MNTLRPEIVRKPFLLLATLVAGLTAVHGFQVPQQTSRFDALVIVDPQATVAPSARPVDSLPQSDSFLAGWKTFRGAHGKQWNVTIDGRSGAPLLAEGEAMPWVPGPGNTLHGATPASVDDLALSLRAFMAGNGSILLARDQELVLNREGSGQVSPELWQIQFDRTISGVPVTGDRYIFYIGHGNLMAFGATRWTNVTTSPTPRLRADEARASLYAYMGLRDADRIEILDPGSLVFTPTTTPGASPDVYAGPIGQGYGAVLTWRHAIRIAGDASTWVGLVDAHSGAIVGFYDDNKYAQVRGGVYPLSSDQICPDGCEQPGYPLPYATVTINGSPTNGNSAGTFTCAPGGATATTTLSGPYVRVSDTCGAVSQSVTCDNDLDLGVSGGADCVIPAGGSSGNTHAARSGFYHLNRIMEHARAWLPGNGWLTQQLTDNVNINATCNAFWNGSSVNFYRSGGGCRNTGEIAGVFLHEWGHGFDQNDGGGFDNPSEAYADIAAFMSTHTSCVGRGFFVSGNCGGYGNACLSCSGIRDLDWDKHSRHVASTPQNFLATNCGSGGGPCGKEVHCEGYVSAEAVWDLATRDLPTLGLDQNTAWQLADRLWYKSRLGSGGNAYNCALPTSDGCSAAAWFTKFRVVDDDDGNLNNGTPHAAAIFAAFNRHRIACGAAADASNQNSSACPSIGTTVLTTTAGSSSVGLSWTPVANASRYYVLRNDASCSAGHTIIATVTGTSYTDAGLINGFSEYYAIQPVGADTDCEGALSNCQAATPQAFVGTVSTDHDLYTCASTIRIIVRDANVGALPPTVRIRSASDTVPEIVQLALTGPARYEGTINTVPGVFVPFDNQVGVQDGDAITVEYTDTDDGQGGTNLQRVYQATADCRFPVITNVQATGVQGASATVSWNTNEASSSDVQFGTSPPGDSGESSATMTTSHSLLLTSLTPCTTYYYRVASTDVAGNNAVADNGGNYFTFTTGKNNILNLQSTQNGIPIPDNNPTGATSRLTVLENKLVTDVNVKVQISHTYDGDIGLYLTSPNGTTVTLSYRRGDSGTGYAGTTFDDEAATPVSQGSGNFQGTFRPDTPLSAIDGSYSAGDWKLSVIDYEINDSGVIGNWSLQLTTPPQGCGPHATYRTQTLLSDQCVQGGSGNADGILDAGERSHFSVTIENDGTVPLTGLTATVTPITPGVTMIIGTAAFGDLAADGLLASQAPSFTSQIPGNLGCGSPVDYQIFIGGGEGSWTSNFTTTLGQPFPGGGTALSETFSQGIPATWTVIDGGNDGGVAATWTTDNPGGRTFNSPISAPAAIVDSDRAGSIANQDEQLITPVLDLAVATNVVLDFDQWFLWFSSNRNEKGDIDIRSSRTGNAWVNLFRNVGDSSPNPNHKTINITTQAAGASNVQIRFRYFQANFEKWWIVDNVVVTYNSPAGCNMTPCAPSSPPPVPDGIFGTPLRATRQNPGGTAIGLIWDVSTCASQDYHLLYGPLASVASHAIAGSLCSLGTAGSYGWTGVPSGNLWYLLVADDGAGREGTWGTMSTGADIQGTTPSGECGITTRSNAGSCP